jgi:hypothetical protein
VRYLAEVKGTVKTPLYKDQKELVGIEGARYELTKRLIDVDGHASKQKLKIISICVAGGLGKTTLTTSR